MAFYAPSAARFFSTERVASRRNKKKGVNILCNGRRNVICTVERERKPRNGVNVTVLCNDDDSESRSPRWTASRARRLSRHYLDRAIKCRQRRVHGGMDSIARTRFTDQRLRRAVAKRFSHGREGSVEQRQMRLFRVRNRRIFGARRRSTCTRRVVY